MDGEVKNELSGFPRIFARTFGVTCAIAALIGDGMLLYIKIFNDGQTFIGH